MRGYRIIYITLNIFKNLFYRIYNILYLSNIKTLINNLIVNNI